MTVWVLIFIFYATETPGMMAGRGLGNVQTIVVSDIASEAACLKLIEAMDPAYRQATVPACYAVEKAAR